MFIKRSGIIHQIYPNLINDIITRGLSLFSLSLNIVTYTLMTILTLINACLFCCWDLRTKNWLIF